MFGPGSSVVVVLELGGWDVAELAVEAPIVEPFDPSEGGQLDVLDVAPRPLPADQFGLVEPVDGLGHRIVMKDHKSVEEFQRLTGAKLVGHV